MDEPTTRVRITWSTLGWRARAWRLVHAAWSILGLATLSYVWVAAFRRRRDRRLAASVAFLLAEGGGLVAGRGDCPMARLQSAWGDPVPFFELVLPPRAAKAAVPVLAVAAIVGMTAVAARPPRGCAGRHRAGEPSPRPAPFLMVARSS